METAPPEDGRTEHSSKFKAGLPLLPSHDDEKKSRTGFSSEVQYIFAVIGMSVGLGNIWRFPSVALKNGGGAFLIPYLCMGVLIGLPMLYIDTSIGQFSQSSPSIAFRQYFPAAQGLGWAMACILISIAFYYVVPCCWAFMYIIQLILGRFSNISSCLNAWNTDNCASNERNSSDTNFSRSAQQEFFDNFILMKHASFEFGYFNWMFAGCLFVCWALTAAVLIKGVQSMGKISLVTTSLPYLIITILFFRGVFLDGAGEGIQFFLTDPDWSKLWLYDTWIAALTQSAFSLSIGVGPMIMMSSYNKRKHQNYRDCVIILCADTFMSVLGGTTCFAILGSMAKQTGKDIKDIVSSALTLTFIAYPEATSQMPMPTLWAPLFFIMLFMVGMSFMFALVEALATCIIDEIPRLAKWHWLVVTITCVVCYLLNLLCFGFQNGFHIFQIFHEFLGSVTLPGALFLEIMIIIIYYGVRRLFRDIQCMHGLPNNLFSRIFGDLGVYIKIAMTFTTPMISVILTCFIIYSLIVGKRLEDGEKQNVFVYPQWTSVLGFIVGGFPLLFVPIGALTNYLQFKKIGKPIPDLFRISEDHPSVRYNLPDPVPWKEFLFPSLRSKVAPIPDSVKRMSLNEDESVPTFPEEEESENANPTPEAPIDDSRV